MNSNLFFNYLNIRITNGVQWFNPVEKAIGVFRLETLILILTELRDPSGRNRFSEI